MASTSTSGRLQRIAEVFWPLAVLVLLLVYTYVRFFAVPYAGFQFNSTTGEVVDLFVADESPSALKIGDKLISVGSQTYQAHHDELGQNLLADVEPGRPIPVVFERNGLERTVSWTPPGFSSAEFLGRLVNTWAVAYVFWIAGTATLLFVRPKDLRWALLLMFFYINAVWLIAGSVSFSAMWGSQYMLRAAIWIAVPIYLQLHANFPRPTKWGASRLWILAYFAAFVIAGLQVFNLIPRATYYLGFAASVLGSAIIMLVRALREHTIRRDLTLLVILFAIAFGPALVLAILSSLVALPTPAAGSIISIVVFPGAYFYVVYRRQLGGAELRANRFVSFYIFIVALVTLLLLVTPLFSSQFTSLSGAGLIVLLSGITIALASVFGFPRFQRFVERRLLRIPRPPDNLLRVFAGRLSTSFTKEHLVDILQKEVLPSLLIRQSALLSFNTQPRQVVYLQGVKARELPSRQQQSKLIRQASQEAEGLLVSPASAWVRLALPLTVVGQPVGLWLLGRKDPDDFYAYAERVLLRALADQTAIALANIAQASNLRTLYQMDADRQEEERARLARELHDDVLNEIALLLAEAEKANPSDHLARRHANLKERLRSLINGLRPPLLNYGLYQAFSHMVDDLLTKSAGVEIHLSVPSTIIQYTPQVEEQIYRIVQQAAENSLKHGKAQLISISGSLEPGLIDLHVEDDGIGFRPGSSELSRLLEEKHFGLAGMNERAALIGARLEIQSAPRRGTQVHIAWRG
jgi:signal transduction histidine kinase